MNNKGQTLILFLLILPIIVSFLAFFIDISIVKYEKNRLDGIIESNLEVIVKKDIKDLDKVKNIFMENEISINRVEIVDNIIILEINKDIKSLFGKVLNFDLYKFDVSYEGNYQEKKVNKIGEL